MTNAPTPAGMAESPMSIAMDALTRLASGTARTFNATTAGQMAASTTAIASDALNRILAAQPSAGAEPVAWRVKDYADGWILFLHEAPARKSAEARNGALVQPLFAHPAPVQPDSGGVVEALRTIADARPSKVPPYGEFWPKTYKGEFDAASTWASDVALAALAPVAAEGGEKDKLRIAVEALRAAREALYHHYVEWDGEPEDAVPLQTAMVDCDEALSALRTEPTGGGEGV